MQNTIIAELSRLREENHIEILYAAESGSRGWGFASADSDYDVRFVYVHQPEWYLSIDPRPDQIELPTDGVLDIVGWDIKKCLLQMKKSNPTLSEWLQSPIVYLEHGGFSGTARTIANRYFSALGVTHHYLHMARAAYDESRSNPEIKLKRYFYMLRPLFACLWVERYGEYPPMNLLLLMAGLDLDALLTQEINRMLARKSVLRESDGENPSPVIMDFVQTTLERIDAVAGSMARSANIGYEPLNVFFRTVLTETWRQPEGGPRI